jgi:hypothetical protein
MFSGRMVQHVVWPRPLFQISQSRVVLQRPMTASREVVEAAAVDPDDRHVAALDQVVERQVLSARLPSSSRRPSGRSSQAEADLDVEVLRREQLQLLGPSRSALISSSRRKASSTERFEVRVDQRPGLRILPPPSLAGQRQLVEDRQQRQA